MKGDLNGTTRFFKLSTTWTRSYQQSAIS